MAKIIEYGIILEDEVATFLEGGYQPYGSPMIGSSGRFYQAMVKYEEEESLKSLGDQLARLDPRTPEEKKKG